MSIFQRLLLAKVETTKGTDAVPTAALNAIRVESFNITPNVKTVDHPVVKQTMGNLPHLVDPNASCTVEIVANIKGSGAAGTASDLSPLFQGCRMVETINAGTSVVYAPSTAVEKTITLYLYKDGLLWKVTGAVGTFTLTAEQGAALKGTFTFQGVYAAPTVVAVPAGATFDATQPIICSSADTMSDGGAIKIGSLTLDAGNDIQEHRVTGEHSFTVANRAPSASWTKDSVGTVAEWSALLNASNIVISSVSGATVGNRVTIAAPAARRVSVAYGERAERDTYEVACNLYESASDDQFTVTFT